MKHGTQAKIIADSIAPSGYRLTTMEVVFPRYLLPEFNTHREFSRNSASSRALPSQALIDHVRDHGFMPSTWYAEGRGMSPSYESDEKEAEEHSYHYRAALRDAVYWAKELIDRNAHHSQVNRLLEPFMWQTVLVSSTSWGNFFAQRLHEDAEPEMYTLALAMQAALDSSDPVERGVTWHLPFVTVEERMSLRLEDQQALSVARCARVSYLRHDGTRDLDRDFELASRLESSGHWSPFEHQAFPELESEYRSGNFRGWTQYRKKFSGEYRGQ